MKELSDLAKRLQAQLRELEIVAAKFNLERLFEVYETDTDLSMGRLLFQGFHKDIAESVFVRTVNKTGGEQDLMLFEHSKNDIVALHLSPKSKQRRGECMG